jgi:mono/diheme cytochrome c family protein
MKKISLSIMALAGSCLLVSFISKNKTIEYTTLPSTSCDTSIVYYKQQVEPLLNSNCAMCHNPQNKKHADGVYLDTYENLKASIHVFTKEGVVINELERVISRGKMPPKSHPALTAAQKAIFLKWIQQGMQNNSCEETAAVASTELTYENNVAPILQKYCYGCHSGPKAANGINLSDSFTVVALIKSDLLIKAITHAEGAKPMPSPTEKLSEADIATIKAWAAGEMR